jgi:hypothetical protein
MNKQLTKKAIGIAASAALTAAALSSTAVADRGNSNKGPKASIDVSVWCDVAPANLTDATLIVNTLVTDSGGEVNAKITDSSITLVEGVGNNRGNNKFSAFGGAVDGPSEIGDVKTVPLDLCAAGMDSAANAVNAMVSVSIVGGHKTFTSMCGDNPLTEDVVESGGVEIGHLGLCP